MAKVPNQTASGSISDLVAQIAAAIGQPVTAEEAVAAGLESLLNTHRVSFAAVVAPQAGKWTTVARAGTERPLPTDLLADVLDREEPAARDGWAVAPLDLRSASSGLLAVYAAGSAQPLSAAELTAVARLLHATKTLSGERAAIGRRIARLEAILEIASQWHAVGETVPLLEQMAQAATRLLECDRASIFLWDRSNRTLVGRPALGVEGGELRIPDNLGIVGQCIATGQPQRASLGGDPAAINRQVDKQTGYQTRTLLCVPLRGSGGKLFGAFEAINKLRGDFTDDDESALVELSAHAAVALEKTQQFEQLLATHRQLVEQASEQAQLIGHSPAIEALRSTIRKVAPTDLAVLLLGENGTGKEVVARLIHNLSRRDRPFIAVNCASISETLLESELFGHERGAFTDAHEMRKGKFEAASGGTLFLDEIGDLSVGGQAKLLRVLEEKVVVRVGSTKPIYTDARVVAATNQDLAQMVRDKRFRQDLFFRLNVVSISLPPLRERPEDVLLLAEHFLTQICRQAHRQMLKISPAARRRLEEHAWPGNVRELRNLMERLVYLLPEDTIQAADLAFITAPGEELSSDVWSALPLAEATDRFQSEFITRAIGRAKGNMSDAARQLGLHRSNLYRKMRQLGMPTGE